MKLALDIIKFLSGQALKLIFILVLIGLCLHLRKKVNQWYDDRELHKHEMESLKSDINLNENQLIQLSKEMKANGSALKQTMDLNKNLKKKILKHNENQPVFFKIEARATWEAKLKVLERSQITAEQSLEEYFKLSRELRKNREGIQNELQIRQKQLIKKTEEWHKYNWYEEHLKTLTTTTLIIAALILTAPLLNRLFWYFLPGAIVERRPSFQLEEKGSYSEIEFLVEPSKQIKIELITDEKICIKQDCYNSFDEELHRKNRFLWDKKSWVISYSAEMVHMTNFENHDKSPRQITLVAPKAEDELCKISLKNCHGLILKPSQIIAIQGDIQLRTAWNFFSIHNWLRLVFRHIIFSGSGDIYLFLHGGGSHLKADSIRIKEEHLVGYQSSCPINLVRNENLWHYLLGRCNLFDYRFNSDKFILMQNQSSTHCKNRTPGEKFFDTILGTIGKFFGF